MNQDLRLALMYGELAERFMRRGEADNAALLASRAAHYAARYASTPDWRRRRGAVRLLLAILKGWSTD
jgi:hypothetical protein